MTSEAPPPPPPPPPPNESTAPPPPPPPPSDDVPAKHDAPDLEFVGTLNAATTGLEEARCLQAEQEASLLLASSLLRHAPTAAATTTTTGTGEDHEVDVSNLPGGVQDAWAVLSEASTRNPAETDMRQASNLMAAAIVMEQEKAIAKKKETVVLGKGQLARAAHASALATSLRRAATVSTKIVEKRKLETPSLVMMQRASALKATRATFQGNNESVDSTTSNSSNVHQWMAVMDERLRQLRAYHARHNVDQEEQLSATATTILGATKRRKLMGNPAADGYDLASIVSSELTAMTRDDAVFTPDEVFGKYLDLKPLHEQSLGTMKHLFCDKEGHVVPLEDFLATLSKGLSTAIPEQDKLRERKKYRRFLTMLQQYLQDFLKRTSPLLHVDSIVQPAIEEFQHEWRQHGGVEGWECKESEKSWVVVSPEQTSSDDKKDGGGGTTTTNTIDLSKYNTAADLEKSVSGDALKTELSRLGLKCGGTVADRAKRLFLTKDTPLDQLPRKVFAKKSATTSGRTDGESLSLDASITGTAPSSLGGAGERRVDLARQEVVVMALLGQLKPTLEATIRRAERRQTQTLNEREQELEEEIYGSTLPQDAIKTGGDDDSDDEEETPIYNPKGVPLGWDGKPIPYWLFKLHGLNHFYPCEICGGESYRGRRNFEKHFAESKHAYGMKCLGIPNTKHFHGVTKIEDAQQLWKKVQTDLEQEQFDGATQEEYEDSHGNVLSRATYEDLARQGLL